MPKKLFFFLFIAFFVFPALKFSGGWLFFLLPMLFFWMFASKHHGGGWCASHHYGDKYDGKRKEKPKRNYIETVDGEYFEVVDEPKRA